MGVDSLLGISLIIKAAVAFLGTIAVLVGVAVVLVYTGTPEPCVDREVSVSSGSRSEFQNKWDAFKLRSATAATSETFTESQITARGVEFLDDEGIDIENLQVYFCPEGYAEATATFVGGGPNIDLLVRGTLDLSGDLPRIDIDKIQGGNLPGFLPLGALVDSIDDEAKSLNISVNLTSIRFSDGAVSIQGAP